jgi:hypothetical protein
MPTEFRHRHKVHGELPGNLAVAWKPLCDNLTSSSLPTQIQSHSKNQTTCRCDPESVAKCHTQK